MILNFNANWSKILIFILCILLIFNVIVGSSVTADASITLTASTIAVIGAALVACGFTFQNSAQMSAVCKHLWNSLTTEQQNFFINSGLTYLNYASITKPFIIKLSKDICSAIGSWIGSFGATADAPSVSIPSAGGITNPLVMRGLPKSSAITTDTPFLYKEDGLFDKIREKGVIVGYVAESPVYLWLKFGGTYYEYYLWFSAFVGRNVLGVDDSRKDTEDYNLGFVGFRASYREDSFKFGADASLSVTFNSEFGKPYLLLNSSGVVREGYSTSSGNGKSLQPFAEFVLTNGQSGAVSIPWTGDYAPRFGGTKELNDETDIVVPGGMIKDNELDDGVVSVMNPDSVRSADVPDVITGTGSIVGEGTGTGIFESIGKWILNIPILGDILKAIIEGFTGLIEFLQELLETIVTAISSAITSVIEFVRDLFIPKNFTWDNFINDVVKIVSPPASVDFRSFVDSTPIPDVTMELKGNTYTVVDNSYLRKNISTFRGIIGAFLAVLLVIYNYNMFMRLMGYSGFSFNDSRKNEKGGNDE